MILKFRRLLFALCFAQTAAVLLNMTVCANTPDAVFSEDVSENAEFADDVFVNVEEMFADSQNVVASGTCGKELGWSLDKYGNLTVYAAGDISASNKGYMTDWVLGNVPWKEYRGSIKKITLPGGIKSIGINAFADCTNLEEINFPNSIRTVGEKAFLRCLKLTAADMKDGVLYIGSDAFGECENLASATVPETVRIIGGRAFYNCKTLKEINLPQTLIELGKEAFFGCENIKSVTVPSEIETIPEGAFAYCKSLDNVKFHKNVSVISDRAFAGCESLTTLTLPSELDTVGESAFSQCKSLSGVNFNQTLQTIGASAFEGCTSLKNISLPQNLIKIGESAFADCTLLAGANIPKKTNSLAGNAFAGDTMLKTLKIDSANENYIYDKNAVYTKDRETLVLAIPSYAGTFEVPDGVKIIGNGAFSKLETLDAVKLPNSVETIEQNAFLECSKLEKAEFGNVVSIGEKAFGFTALEDVALPESVRYIGGMAFSGCKNLKSVVIEGFVKEIPASCFEECEKLERAEIGEGTEIIDNLAFGGCTSLSEIYLPDSVREICNQAFKDSALEKIRVSENIKEISHGAFDNVLLKEFYYGSTPEKFVLSGIYASIPETAVVYYTLNNSENSVSLVTSDAKNTLAATLNADAADSDTLPETAKIALGGKKTAVMNISLVSAAGQNSSPEGKLIVGTDIPDGLSKNMNVFRLETDGTLKALNGRYTHEKFVFETDALGTFVFADAAYTAGDVDGNGSVDIDDAILLFRHSMLPELYPIDYAGNTDFNKDGKLDIDDAILLFRHSMLPELYPID